MAKVKTYQIHPREKHEIIGELFDIISRLQNKSEIIDFLVGLLTPSEALMMARRIQVAQMLIEDQNYETIRKKLKVSYQTITKTDQWIHKEDEKYNKWITECIRKREIKVKGAGYKSLLDKYRHHKALRDLIS